MICTGCIEDKDPSQFCNDSTHKNGKSSRCKSCKNKYNIEWKKNNPEKAAAHIPSRKQWRLDNLEHDKNRNREYWIKNPILRLTYRLNKEYNITLKRYEEMLQAQDNKCAVCKINFSELKRKPCVDHCHKTGVVRGLLCHKCNVSIGLLNEDFGTVLNLVKYLIDFE